MREEVPSLGTPPRLLAEECVLRALLDVLQRIYPSAVPLVFDRAHMRLTKLGPQTPQEAGFFMRAHDAIDAIMQVPTREEISSRRADMASLATEAPNRAAA